MKKLKDLIKMKNTKQSWLAEKLGVHPVTVSNWCRGTTAPSKGMLIAIAQIFEVELKDLDDEQV